MEQLKHVRISVQLELTANELITDEMIDVWIDGCKLSNPESTPGTISCKLVKIRRE